jgi:hypothetical protein
MPIVIVLATTSVLGRGRKGRMDSWPVRYLILSSTHSTNNRDDLIYNSNDFEIAWLNEEHE